MICGFALKPSYLFTLWHYLQSVSIHLRFGISTDVTDEDAIGPTIYTGAPESRDIPTTMGRDRLVRK
jgi:hypothetical protein